MKFLLLSLLLMLTSCLTNNETQKNENDNKLTNEMVLGESFGEQDPFDVKNMRLAFKELMLEKQKIKLGKLVSSSDSLHRDSIYEELEANYLYVRFLPKDSIEEDYIHSRDTNLVLHPYPLDREILEEGDYWVDSTLQRQTQDYYTAVPIGYDLGDTVEYEVLKELFLIEPFIDSLEESSNEGETFLAKFKVNRSLSNTAKINSILKDADLSLEQLRMMAFQRVNKLHLLSNTFSTDLKTTKFAKIKNQLKKANDVTKADIVQGFLWPTRWRPSGTLRYQDNSLGYSMPVQGVRVTAGYWYYWRSSKTDGGGYFRSPEKWTWSVKYKAHWDSYHFLLEDGHSIYGADLVTQGPTKKSQWNRTFTGNDARYAVIFNACNYYYNYPIKNLKRPRKNGWFNAKLDLQIYDSHGDDGVGVHVVVPWLMNWIQIDLKSNNLYRNHQDLYGTTIHELAHSAHFEHFETRDWKLSRGFEWGNISSKVQETFARAVQYKLTDLYYPGYLPFYKQGEYTGLFQDLNDSNTDWATKGFGLDNVRGMRIKEFENVVLKSFTKSELKSNILQKYPNGSFGRIWYKKTDLDKLFNYWYP